MDELVDALRKHADWINACESTSAYAPKCVCDWAKDMRDAADALKAADKRIAELEAVDVVPVVHGEWIDNGNVTYSCNRCGSWIPNEQHFYARYCLYCGARMDGGTEHGNTYSLGKIEMPKGAMKQIIADGERKDGEHEYEIEEGER